MIGKLEDFDMTIDVKVPDIGDFSDVPVVTVLVSVGDAVSYTHLTLPTKA